MRIKVAVAQFAPKKSDVPANLDRIAEATRLAQAQSADLVIFPETATSGYFLEMGVIESAMTGDELLEGLVERLGRPERSIDLCVGFYERGDEATYNSAAYLEIGPEPKLRHVYRKFFLPTYGVFDEHRFVAEGHSVGLAETRFGTVGLMICEDVWHSTLGTLVAMNGAKIVLVPSASPARGFQGERPENVVRYERMCKSLAEEHGVFCVLAMLTGFEGGKGFSGGSMAFDPFGRKIAEAPVVEEALLVFEADLSDIEVARAKSPLLSDLRARWSDVLRLAKQVSLEG